MKPTSKFPESNHYAITDNFAGMFELGGAGSPSAAAFVVKTRVQRLAPLPPSGLCFPTRSQVEYIYYVADHLTGEELIKT